MKHAIEIKASDVTNNRDPKQRVRYLEHVVLKLHIDHHRRGDLEIKLKSPQGTPSILLERRMYDRSTKVCKGSAHSECNFEIFSKVTSKRPIMTNS